MLQTRRAAFRLAQRPHRFHWRGYTDTKPPDPTNSDREPDHKPVNEPIGGGDSSGTDSVHAASAGHYESTHHAHHPEPVNEDLGRGLYITIATLALSFAVYKFSHSSSNDPASAGNPDKQPLPTRIMQYYRFWEDRFADRNALHTKMVEQAGADRHLFEGSPWTHHIELRFPELFNSGSPYNVPAGHSADLSELKAHYQQRAVEIHEKQMARLTTEAGDSERLAQRREAEEGQVQEKKRSTSVSSILESVGLKRPQK